MTTGSFRLGRTSARPRRARAAIVPLAVAALAFDPGRVAAATRSAATPDSIGAYAFCSTDLVITDRGWFPTSDPPGTTSEFTAPAGLWVGAIADRGAGPDTSVSTGLWPGEFDGPEPGHGSSPAASRGVPPVTVAFEGFQVAYTDTNPFPFPPTHMPLGIEVRQDSRILVDPDLGGLVTVKFRLENISPEYRPPGWSLQNVYIGMMADPDVGVTDPDLRYWEDDHGGFVRGRTSGGAGIPPGAKWGDLAYAYDQPDTGGDDVDAQYGIVLLGRRTHAFRVWSGGFEDPRNDIDRYFLLRGSSDTEPTIDPPTARASDQRILLSMPRIPVLAPGESVTFAFAFACGQLVPVSVPDPGRGTPAPARAAVSVTPNPVRLGGGGLAGGGVRFSDLPVRSTVRIYSVGGRLLREIDPNGASSSSWDLKTSHGLSVPPGAYFYRVIGPGAEPAVGKLVVVR